MYLKAKKKLADLRRNQIAHGDTDDVLCAVSIGLEALADALHKDSQKTLATIEDIALQIRNMQAGKH